MHRCACRRACAAARRAAAALGPVARHDPGACQGIGRWGGSPLTREQLQLWAVGAPKVQAEAGGAGGPGGGLGVGVKQQAGQQLGGRLVPAHQRAGCRGGQGGRRCWPRVGRGQHGANRAFRTPGPLPQQQGRRWRAARGMPASPTCGKDGQAHGDARRRRHDGRSASARRPRACRAACGIRQRRHRLQQAGHRVKHGGWIVRELKLHARQQAQHHPAHTQVRAGGRWGVVAGWLARMGGCWWRGGRGGAAAGRHPDS